MGLMHRKGHAGLTGAVHDGVEVPVGEELSDFIRSDIDHVKRNGKRYVAWIASTEVVQDIDDEAILGESICYV
jgi:hypothetical protein